MGPPRHPHRRPLPGRVGDAPRAGDPGGRRLAGGGTDAAPMSGDTLRAELARFDPSLPIEKAWTPPASWYRGSDFLELERTRLFGRTWQAVARLDQVAHPGDYVAGCLADLPYVVLRDGSGTLRAFHNVCRHHAAQVCEGAGTLDELTCPYHGWTYRLDGRLTRAPHLGRNDVFDLDRFSLKPAAVAAWDPLVFL